ncbi:MULTISPECIES: hypothetical protein [Ensifer]|uniref:Uncharacterized protein n=1 Tax=Ensifer adhaerens TaxID=106592 RepID=A0ACC5T536_ENSAD|nr:MULTISPECIES: hypothetical protein [Ensifer]MBP1875774.1 hypothetical protein [Ensifer adhaerens]
MALPGPAFILALVAFIVVVPLAAKKAEQSRIYNHSITTNF